MDDKVTKSDVTEITQSQHEDGYSNESWRSIEDRVERLERTNKKMWPAILNATAKTDQLEAALRDYSISGAWEVSLKSFDVPTNFIPWHNCHSLVPVFPAPGQIFMDEQEQSLMNHFLEIRDTLTKFEEDFEDFSRRIIWADTLEEQLAVLEDGVDEDNMKYLSWAVCAIRDSLKYNYAEQLTANQFSAIKNSVVLICEKKESLDQDTFNVLHSNLLSSGLALLPVTEKAIKNTED